MSTSSSAPSTPTAWSSSKPTLAPGKRVAHLWRTLRQRWDRASLIQLCFFRVRKTARPSVGLAIFTSEPNPRGPDPFSTTPGTLPPRAPQSLKAHIRQLHSLWASHPFPLLDSRVAAYENTANWHRIFNVVHPRVTPLKQQCFAWLEEGQLDPFRRGAVWDNPVTTRRSSAPLAGPESIPSSASGP